MKLEQKYIKAIYAGLHSTDKNKYKEDLVASFTDGRTTSVREMSTQEALDLIKHLSDEGKQDQIRGKMIKAIYAICYNLGFTHSNGDLDKERMQGLVKTLSPKNKSLQDHSYKELQVLVSLFQRYYRQQLKKE